MFAGLLRQLRCETERNKVSRSLGRRRLLLQVRCLQPVLLLLQPILASTSPSPACVCNLMASTPPTEPARFITTSRAMFSARR